MRNITKILSFTLLLFISCNENQKSEQTDKKQADNNLEFKNSYLNSPKLFSKFWIDMTETDFHRVIDTLKSERKVTQKSDSIFYDLNGYEMYLTETFENGKLKKITLRSPIQPIWHNQKYSPYNIFKEKYKLPELKQKDKYYQRTTFPNSEFKGVYQVYLDNNTSESVPNSLIDNYSSKYDRFKRSDENEQRLTLSQNKITVNKNGKIRIILEEVPSIGTKQNEKGGTDLVYSLEDSNHNIPLEIQRKYSIGPNEINFAYDGYKTFKDQKSMETIGNYLIRKNSKYVTQCYYQNFDLKITYATNEYLNIEKKKEIDSEKQRMELDKRIKEANEKENAQRKREALEEI